MGGPGSGPRRNRVHVDPALALPDAGDSEESVMAYVRAVQDAVVHEQLDRMDGETLIKGANTILTGIRQVKERGLIGRLVRLEALVETAQREGKERLIAQRRRLKQKDPK